MLSHRLISSCLVLSVAPWLVQCGHGSNQSAADLKLFSSHADDWGNDDNLSSIRSLINKVFASLLKAGLTSSDLSSFKAASQDAVQSMSEGLQTSYLKYDQVADSDILERNLLRTVQEKAWRAYKLMREGQDQEAFDLLKSTSMQDVFGPHGEHNALTRVLGMYSIFDNDLATVLHQGGGYDAYPAHMPPEQTAKILSDMMLSPSHEDPAIVEQFFKNLTDPFFVKLLQLIGQRNISRQDMRPAYEMLLSKGAEIKDSKYVEAAIEAKFPRDRFKVTREYKGAATVGVVYKLLIKDKNSGEQKTAAIKIYRFDIEQNMQEGIEAFARCFEQSLENYLRERYPAVYDSNGVSEDLAREKQLHDILRKDLLDRYRAQQKMNLFEVNAGEEIKNIQKASQLFSRKDRLSETVRLLEMRGMRNDPLLDKQFPSVVMEFIEGITLDQYLNSLVSELKREGKNKKELQDKFERLMDGLQDLYFHWYKGVAGGLIHLDPHAGNIMIDSKTGLPVLVDWGAATPIRSQDFENALYLWGGVLSSDRETIVKALSHEQLTPEQKQQINNIVNQILIKGAWQEIKRKNPRDRLLAQNVAKYYELRAALAKLPFVTYPSSVTQVLNAWAKLLQVEETTKGLINHVFETSEEIAARIDLDSFPQENIWEILTFGFQHRACSLSKVLCHFSSRWAQKSFTNALFENGRILSEEEKFGLLRNRALLGTGAVITIGGISWLVGPHVAKVYNERIVPFFTEQYNKLTQPRPSHAPDQVDDDGAVNDGTVTPEVQQESPDAQTGSVPAEAGVAL